MQSVVSERFVEIVEEIRHREKVAATDNSFYKELLDITLSTFKNIKRGRGPTFTQVYLLSQNEKYMISMEWLFRGIGSMFLSDRTDGPPEQSMLLSTDTPIQQLIANESKIIQLLEIVVKKTSDTN